MAKRKDGFNHWAPLNTILAVLPSMRGKGRESTSAWSPSWLTTLNEEAAMRNNEVLH